MWILQGAGGGQGGYITSMDSRGGMDRGHRGIRDRDQHRGHRVCDSRRPAIWIDQLRAAIGAWGAQRRGQRVHHHRTSAAERRAAARGDIECIFSGGGRRGGHDSIHPSAYMPTKGVELVYGWGGGWDGLP